jgi:ubiquinone/menaquinone biosynthesis C-methylase UbiE
VIRLKRLVNGARLNGMPDPLVNRTRRVYDRLASVYPLSTALFHSRAHRCALEISGLRDGMQILEVATGSGEMFRGLVRANSSGSTVGVDSAPKMAARTLRAVRREMPYCRAHCQAVDVRQMPFRSESFDAVFCCYLLELLPDHDILLALGEFRRVLRHDGRLTLVLISRSTRIFNVIYGLLGKLAPAFWGRQVEESVPNLLEAANFRFLHDRLVSQNFYPSHVLVAQKLPESVLPFLGAGSAPAPSTLRQP